MFTTFLLGRFGLSFFDGVLQLILNQLPSELKQCNIIIIIKCDTEQCFFKCRFTTKYDRILQTHFGAFNVGRKNHTNRC